MFRLIDDFLNRITMYQLVLYFLIILLLSAMFLGAFGLLPYPPQTLLLTTAVVILLSLGANRLFAAVYEAPTNLESVYISALILVLILPPLQQPADFGLIFWASVLTEAGKYILAIGRKHLFNPVAVAVVLTAYGFGGFASWWVGASWLTPLLAAGAYLIVRKLKREDLVYAFIATAVTVGTFITTAQGGGVLGFLNQLLFHSSLLFFAGVMLTEPLTTPPTATLQTLYGIIVGFLFLPQIHFGSFYTTPEIALVIGNIFSYLVSPKDKLWLTLKDKVKLAPDIYDFIFAAPKKIKFRPGQYMEWTLAHDRTDLRGSRRYFTLSSSPTENDVRVGIKFYNPGSSYKKALMSLNGSTPIVTSQLAGNFTLPRDKNLRLVFLAGGIGITPFRSMVKYLMDKHESRDIILIYSNRTPAEIVYRDVFDTAAASLPGFKVVYTLTDPQSVPSDWIGNVGRIDEKMITADIPDYKNRTFFISGTHQMVAATEADLKRLNIPDSRIITDYFPGFA